MDQQDKCFACGKRLGKSPSKATTTDGQIVFVGRDCFSKVLSAVRGYQPPKGGPRLYPLPTK